MKNKIIYLKPFNNKIFYKNAIFNEHIPAGSSYLIAAKRLAEKNGFSIDTIDLCKNKRADHFVFMDIPYPWELWLWIKIIFNRSKNILFLVEPPIVNPFNYFKLLHIFFSKVYTWNDDLVDNHKYHKYYLPKVNYDINAKQIPFIKKRFLVSISGNLSPFLPFQLLSLSTRELYTERMKAIGYFDSHSPDFSLYGRNWNKPQRFNIAQRFTGFKFYKSYKGILALNEKHNTLSRFKFALCFENSEIPGYISEKIFDCFKAKCVPIYLGAPNINQFIPVNCFIDFRKFNNYKLLIKFLRDMDEVKYNIYIKNIMLFLKNKTTISTWSVDSFANIFLFNYRIE